MLYFDENVVDIERNESEKTFPLLFKYIGDEGNERTNYLYHNPEFKWLKIYSDDGSEHLGYICITFNHFHDLSMGQNQSCHISILEIKDKGQGLGTQVMNDVFVFAKDNNFKYITLQAKNDRVRDWYMKLGFYYSIDKSFLIKQVSFEIPNYKYTLNEKHRLNEVAATDAGQRLATRVNKYLQYLEGNSNFSEEDFIEYCKWFLSAVASGTEKIQDNLPDFYQRVQGDTASKTIAYAIIHCTDTPKALEFFRNHREHINYDPVVVDLAIQLAQENNDGLVNNQRNAENILH